MSAADVELREARMAYAAWMALYLLILGAVVAFGAGIAGLWLIAGIAGFVAFTAGFVLFAVSMS